MIAVITLILLFGPMAAIFMIVLYLRGILIQIQTLRKELEHRAENDIKMFNANREAAGLGPL